MPGSTRAATLEPQLVLRVAAKAKRRIAVDGPAPISLDQLFIVEFMLFGHKASGRVNRFTVCVAPFCAKPAQLTADPADRSDDPAANLAFELLGKFTPPLGSATGLVSDLVGAAERHSSDAGAYVSLDDGALKPLTKVRRVGG